MNNVLMEAMLSRKSVRNYLNKPIPVDKMNAIKEYLADESNYTAPYNSSIRFELLEHGNVDTKNLITNAPAYVIVIIENNHKALFDVGYVFEKFVLFLESLGLGTCYLSSGFQRNSVVLAKHLEDDEVMILASPIGFEGGKKSLKAKGCDIYLKRNRRKDIDEMFFADKERTLITDAGIREKLKYLVWAPSGLNTQPWRIIFEDEKAHFYIDKKIAKEKRMGLDIHILDIGIVACHYAIAFSKNHFTTETKPVEYDDMDYIITIE